MREALSGFPEGHPIPVTLGTTEGDVRCTLVPSRAPRAVAMFVGLATGRSAWRDPRSGRVVREPYYEDRAVFRAIDGVLVQTGCPVGDGSGHPGYRLEVESSEDDRALLREPGALLFARYTPPPDRADPDPPPPGHVIGAQIVVTLADMSHLAGEVTVLGVCMDLDVVARVAQLVASRARAVMLTGVHVAPASAGASSNDDAMVGDDALHGGGGGVGEGTIGLGRVGAIGPREASRGSERTGRLPSARRGLRLVGVTDLAGLEEAAALASVTSVAGPLRACAEAAPADLAGELRVGVAFTTDGAVLGASRDGASSMPDGPTVTCVLGALSKMRARVDGRAARAKIVLQLAPISER